MTGQKREASELPPTRPRGKVRRLNTPPVAREGTDLLGGISDDEMVAAHTAWELQVQPSLGAGVVPGNVTPTLLVSAFRQLRHRSANDIIKHLNIPHGAWAKDLRQLERLYADQSGQQPIADDNAYAQLDRDMAQMQRVGLLAVVRDVAKHHVEGGATGPEACDEVGLSTRHRNLADEVGCYAAQRDIDAGLRIDEACRINEVEKDLRGQVSDYAMEVWTQERRRQQRDARRQTNTGPFPIDSDDDTCSQERMYVEAPPKVTLRVAQPRMGVEAGRWMAKATETIRQRSATRRTIGTGFELTEALRERVQGNSRCTAPPPTAQDITVPDGRLNKFLLRGRVWRLGRALAAYAQRHGTSRNGAPYLDMIGLRYRAPPSQSDSAERQCVDRLLDEIVLPGSRHDVTRQNVVDLVMGSPAAMMVAPLSPSARSCDNESAVADRLVLDLHETGQFSFDSPFRTGKALRDGFSHAMERITAATSMGALIDGLNQFEIKLKANTRIDTFFKIADRVNFEAGRVSATAGQSEPNNGANRAARSVAYLVEALIPDQDGCVVLRKALIDLIISRRHEWMDPAMPRLHEMEGMFLPTQIDRDLLHDVQASYKLKLDATHRMEAALRQQSRIDLPRHQGALQALAAGVDAYVRVLAVREAQAMDRCPKSQAKECAVDQERRRTTMGSSRSTRDCR